MLSRQAWWTAPLPASSSDRQDARGEDSSAPGHAPPDWSEAAERISREDIRKALVIGAADVGKSTLCRFLVSRAAGCGRRATLLDTDVGQKTIGPPACVTRGDSHGMTLFFVGTTNPVQGWRQLIEGTRRLSGGADAELVVANTSGLLAGPGRRLKAAKIEALRPSLLIALGDNSDLAAILSDHPKVPTLRLSPSPEARRKTEGEKRASRREAFRRYFAGASVQSFEGCQLQIEGREAPLPSGLLLGLSAAHDGPHGLGILVGYSNAIVKILTPVATSGVRRITPGSLCLNDAFAETSVKPAP
jgi:polynucleotide 5'-hydroxyl-kinase GRC3/NOL9